MKEVELAILNLLEQHPKCLSVITEHFMKVMIDSFDTEEVPEEFKQSMRDTGISKERLAMIIGGAPRCLFDVFDENEIFIEIYRTQSKAFTFNIEDYVDHPDHYMSRKDCELKAIIAAFTVLEEICHERVV